MSKPQLFDSASFTVGLDSRGVAELIPNRLGPPPRVDGLSIGVASMSRSAPHGGEMHPDGDEVLILVSGRARVTLETDPVEDVTMETGDGLIVPKGVWHKVEILEPCQVVYMTPGPGFEFRPLDPQ